MVTKPHLACKYGFVPNNTKPPNNKGKINPKYFFDIKPPTKIINKYKDKIKVIITG